ncbi:hypothetical protein AGDE_14119 [Angomonas deanei]|uniref:Uncharacterized protein n=1 Tax=Angomonas deanei TaxID=59799 RepID=A0A7G2CS66_9TRYP|nr:hypothetical protein AGDE_14119 [Angomonas deanei]CAD2222017.1 hypothetical protein, conserved [Angomonas deanei]|eukprot:EPY21382.1 hypothetical protein AGDE_14119 [Angomonas deanei]
MKKTGYTPQCSPRFYATTGCFGEYVRGEYRNANFGCCVVTNCEDELDLLYKSGDYIDDWGAEMTEIDKWIQGKYMRTMHTLSIGGESGSGKTRAALHGANFCSWARNGRKREDILTVYIKVSRESTNTWNSDVEDKDVFTRKAVRIMQEMWDKNEEYKRLFPECKSHAFLEECIKSSAVERNDLRRLRAVLCHDWLCRVIKKATQFQGWLGSNNPFKVAFIVLDEVESCPWLYNAVNGNSTDSDYISKFFTHYSSLLKSIVLSV